MPEELKELLIKELDPKKWTDIPANQFMYCLKGKYEYTATAIVLTPGTFYMNPKGHPHGPTMAHEDSLLLEMYDGPHYFETPPYHTEETVGKVVGKKPA